MEKKIIKGIQMLTVRRLSNSTPPFWIPVWRHEAGRGLSARATHGSRMTFGPQSHSNEASPRRTKCSFVAYSFVYVLTQINNIILAIVSLCSLATRTVERLSKCWEKCCECMKVLLLWFLSGIRHYTAPHRCRRVRIIRI